MIWYKMFDMQTIMTLNKDQYEPMMKCDDSVLHSSFARIVCKLNSLTFSSKRSVTQFPVSPHSQQTGAVVQVWSSHAQRARLLFSSRSGCAAVEPWRALRGRGLGLGRWCCLSACAARAAHPPAIWDRTRACFSFFVFINTPMEMDGTEPNRRNCTKSDGAAARDQQSGSKERVTLKKEIGLMSACAIIIGKFIPECVCMLACVFIKDS